ncbi:MAG: hypothetical protein RL122_2163 [Pseudomonadota bacterium]|jgi:hypothetical protein|uniref:Uncharacterized protein n=1 Tax=Thiothrix fructosivorans TaxID=111770 RepID=A0A8B0SRM7_9GAMM|nr:hypothetical protein [Thiothrix fructosivorans]MBO0614186.1 hypothetical protein [Thiothrix fructosivorans]QTX12668.1 hypothetical protein J1836_010235 [Thiothrix fructosivorans]
MEYVLLGVLLLGAVLFLLGWLVMAGICFQRHPVTGLVALIPGVNLLTLPAMWHRVGGWVITSFIGVLLAAVAWFAGANQHVYRHAQAMGIPITASAPSTEPTARQPADAAQPMGVTHTIEIPPAARTTPAGAVTATAPVTPVVASAQPAAPNPAELLVGAKALPSSALYHVVFNSIAVSKLADNAEQYVRIVQKDGHRREGKLMTATANEIGLEERMEGGAVTRTIKLSEIREAFLMMHEKGKE